MSTTLKSPTARAVLLPLLLTLFLAACNDDKTYTTIQEAPPPDVNVVVTTQAEALTIEIDSVTVAGQPVVEFTAYDELGLPFVGVKPGDLRFTFAKLVPASNGDASRWQNYINRSENPGVGPGTVSTTQGTSESNGTLVNNFDGSYTYTFATDVTAVTSPLAVTWEPSLVHRVAIQLGGGYPAHNPYYDFIPATGATMGFDNRSIVQVESCNECHGKLSFHGGGRIETELCVTCHNPGTTDANSGNTVDFKVMIHKIHRGANLPSVIAGTPYQIYGYRNSLHDYSDVHFPQSIQNCTKCHDDADADTPQASNWHEFPTLEACGSCHDDVDFAQGVAGGHPGGVVTDNAECSTCHAETRVAGSVQESHHMISQDWSDRFAYEVVSVTDSGPGQFPQVTFRVVDPTNGNAPYDLSGPEFTSGASSLSIDLAWDTRDYRNEDAGNAPARAVSISGTSGVDNGDGTYTVTSPVAVPADITGSGAVGIEGHPAGDFDGDGTYTDRVAVTSVVDWFAITDAAPVPRRQIVAMEKCQSCHGERDGLAFHGANRTDNPQMCALCHNANNTDLAMRPTDPDGTDNEINTAAADGKEEESIDLKRMIHGIHGSHHRENDLVIYGFRNSVHNFSEVHFPGRLNDCETCHLPGTYTLPLADGVLATTIDTQATVNNSSAFGTQDFTPLAAAFDVDDDGNIGPIAAACSGCHDSDLAQQHMILNGSSFDALQADFDNGAYVETCEVCHGEGRTADIEEVHAPD